MRRLAGAVVWLIAAAAAAYFLFGVWSGDENMAPRVAVLLAGSVIASGVNLLLVGYDSVDEDIRNGHGAS